MGKGQFQDVIHIFIAAKQIRLGFIGFHGALGSGIWDLGSDHLRPTSYFRLPPAAPHSKIVFR